MYVSAWAYCCWLLRCCIRWTKQWTTTNNNWIPISSELYNCTLQQYVTVSNPRDIARTFFFQKKSENFISAIINFKRLFKITEVCLAQKISRKELMASKHKEKEKKKQMKYTANKNSFPAAWILKKKWVAQANFLMLGQCNSSQNLMTVASF